MTPDQINKLRSMLVGACDKYIASGGTVISGSFDSGVGYCPITCLIGVVDNLANIRAKIVKLLDIPDADFSSFWEFTDGFDNAGGINTPLNALGQELRAKYIKETP